MTFVNKRIEDGTIQTIDHERNTALKGSGPYPEYGYHFELCIGDQTVRFSRDSGMKIHGDSKPGESRQYDMNWQIYELVIPLTLQDKKKRNYGFDKGSFRSMGG